MHFLSYIHIQHTQHKIHICTLEQDIAFLQMLKRMGCVLTASNSRCSCYRWPVLCLQVYHSCSGAPLGTDTPPRIEPCNHKAVCKTSKGWRASARNWLKTRLKTKLNLETWVRERPPFVNEVSANFFGSRVLRGQRDGFLLPYSRLSRPEPLLFLPSSSSIVLKRLSGPRSRPTTSQKIW
jgi:hypothetical protein